MALLNVKTHISDNASNISNTNNTKEVQSWLQVEYSIVEI